MTTQSRAPRHSLQNKTVGIKAWVCAQPNTTKSRKLHVVGFTVIFADGIFQNSTLWLDQEGKASERSLSSHKRKGTPPLLKGRAESPHATTRQRKRRRTVWLPNKKLVKPLAAARRKPEHGERPRPHPNQTHEDSHGPLEPNRTQICPPLPPVWARCATGSHEGNHGRRTSSCKLETSELQSYLQLKMFQLQSHL
jgi:hypothetical protein